MLDISMPDDVRMMRNKLIDGCCEGQELVERLKTFGIKLNNHELPDFLSALRRLCERPVGRRYKALLREEEKVVERLEQMRARYDSLSEFIRFYGSNTDIFPQQS